MGNQRPNKGNSVAEEVESESLSTDKEILFDGFKHMVDGKWLGKLLDLCIEMEEKVKEVLEAGKNKREGKLRLRRFRSKMKTTKRVEGKL